MPGLSITLSGAALGGPRFAASVERGFALAAKYVEADLKRNAFTGRARSGGLLRGGSMTPGALAAPTGRTRATITSQVFSYRKGQSAQTLAVIGSPVRWLPIHERGGTIHGNPWLAIPTRFANKGGRGVPGFWLGTKAGNLLRMSQVGRGRYLPTLLLARKVTIPARRMFETSRKRVASAVTRIVQGALEVS